MPVIIPYIIMILDNIPIQNISFLYHLSSIISVIVIYLLIYINVNKYSNNAIRYRLSHIHISIIVIFNGMLSFLNVIFSLFMSKHFHIFLLIFYLIPCYIFFFQVIYSMGLYFVYILYYIFVIEVFLFFYYLFLLIYLFLLLLYICFYFSDSYFCMLLFLLRNNCLSYSLLVYIY